jgi:hypothetical protein
MRLTPISLIGDGVGTTVVVTSGLADEDGLTVGKRGPP